MAGASSTKPASAKAKALADAKSPVAPAGTPAAPPPVAPPVDLPAAGVADTGGDVGAPPPIALVAVNDSEALIAAIRELGGVVLFDGQESRVLHRIENGDLTAELELRVSQDRIIPADFPAELRAFLTDPEDVAALVKDAIGQAVADGAIAGIEHLIAAPPTGRRRHPVAMRLDYDGKVYELGEQLTVSYDEFVSFRASSVFEGKWDDGDEA